MNRAEEAEWLQKLILLGIGLIIGNTENTLGLPYDSQLKHAIDPVSLQYQESAPLVLLILVAFYVGFEALTENIHIETVFFFEPEPHDLEA
ncbi:hypothetical protein [Haloterrigena alkaliphila]|uniref:hypothetical protein n=1 Tax=Haloterrigena alkaliphila TaxID=2816475 RepID=UPI001CFF788B|nr:hypothetical protein [Haloterrigena alkaliphila]UHQ95083.1 hypothetical protein J0X25_19705 [Haloterrigena alkaliphila]